jgi:integrase
MGALYRRGQVWWIKYYVNGRPMRESTGVVSDTDTPPNEAKRIMKVKEGKAANGEPVMQRTDRVRYDEAAKDLRTHYKTTGARDITEVEKRLKHLDVFFAGYRLVGIGAAEVAKYVAKRQAAGAANGTVNRELAVLARMLKLAYEHTKLARMPIIRKLREAAPRSGFVERPALEAIVEKLPEPHGLAIRLCYTLAWRRAEVFSLQWRHVDLDRGIVRLEPGETKNGEGRTAFLTGELLDGLRDYRTKVEALQRRLERVIPDVFVRLKGKLAGQRLGSFRKRWDRACEAAGVPGLLVHDLRRSGVRNLVRAGVSEHTAMKISGHLTRSVFDRYDIVSESDLQEAAQRLDGHKNGHNRRGAVQSLPVTR